MRQNLLLDNTQIEKTADSIPYNDYKKFIEYISKQINTKEFPKIKKRAVKIMGDEYCPAALRIVLGEWFFTKMYMMYRIPADLRKEISINMEKAVESCRSEVLKSKYIYVHNMDACIDMLAHFYVTRFADEHFILQMVNDAYLLKWEQNLIPSAELRTHFLKWIKSTPDLAQQSNLLDILLQYFHNDSEIQEIYSSMKGGDSIYDNTQNVHDDTISAAVNTALSKLIEWHMKNLPNLGSNSEAVFTDTVFRNFSMTPDQMKIYDGIWKRTTIDKTSVTVKLQKPQNSVLADEIMSVCAFDVMFALANLLQTHKYATSIVNTLLEDMEEGVSLCISGYFARFMSCLQGYDDRFIIKIPFFDQLYANISLLIIERIKKLPEDSDILLGTYDEEYQKLYFDFLVKNINLSKLYENYGREDIIETLPKVMDKYTQVNCWSASNNRLTYKL